METSILMFTSTDTLDEWIQYIRHDMVLLIVREITLLILIGSLMYRIRIMNANTKKWNGLGIAFRLENFIYVLLWLWAFVTPIFPHVRHPIVVVLLSIALTAITLRVTFLLPKIEHAMQQVPIAEVVEPLSQISKLANEVETVKHELIDHRQKVEDTDCRV